MTITLENILYKFDGFLVSDFMLYVVLPNVNGDEFKILILLLKRTSKLNDKLDGVSIKDISKFTSIDETRVKSLIKNLILMELVQEYKGFNKDKYNELLYRVPSKLLGLKFLKNLNKTTPINQNIESTQVKEFEGGESENDMFSKYKLKK